MPADDPDRVEGEIGGGGELHARADAAAQVVKELGGDALPGNDARYAGRVRGDLLRADTSGRLAGRDGFLRDEERVAGQQEMSAQVPYGVGLTIKAPAASGRFCQACSTCSGEGGCATCSRVS